MYIKRNGDKDYRERVIEHRAGVFESTIAVFFLTFVMMVSYLCMQICKVSYGVEKEFLLKAGLGLLSLSVVLLAYKTSITIVTDTDGDKVKKRLHVYSPYDELQGMLFFSLLLGTYFTATFFLAVN